MPVTPFLDFAPLYWAAGIPAIPLKQRQKMPILSDWTAYCTNMPSAAVRELWLNSYPRSNLGLPFGEASGLCAIDIDTTDEALIATIEDCLPASPWRRVGAKGCALVFKWQGQKNFKIRSDAGMIVEFLAHGNQLVLPPSIHPDTGKPYVADTNLWEVMDKVPMLGVDIEQRLRDALGVKGATRPGGTRRGSITSQAGQPESVIVERDGVERYLAEELSVARGEIEATLEGDRNNTLFKMAARVARHVSAAKADWAPFAEGVAESARTAGLDDPAISATLESGWKCGAAEPTLWVSVARDYVYLSHQERFHHLPSGKDLKPTGFNGHYGSPHPGKGTFSNFLLFNGYVRKVYDLTYEPLNPDRLLHHEGMDWLNTFRPSEVIPMAGDPAPFIDFLSGLVPDESERDHLLNMVAFTVRHPGHKLRVLSN